MPDALRQTIRALPCRLVACKLAAVALLVVAIAEISLVTKLDIALVREINGVTAGWLTGIVALVSDLAGTQTLLWLTAAAVIALGALRHWRGAAALAIAVATTQLTVTVAKALMTRPRPADEIAVSDSAGWSFPSAHSASAVALYVMLALITTTLWRRKLQPTIAFAIAGAIVVAVGLSRLYLGVHYPTDVLAGWLIGGIIVVASWTACSRLPAPALRPSPA